MCIADESHGSYAAKEDLKQLLARFGKTSSNIAFVLSDHAPVMPCLVQRLTQDLIDLGKEQLIPFLGRQAHRLDLVCKRLGDKFQSEIKAVSDISLFILHHKTYLSLLLKKTDGKKALELQATRWSSTDSMMQRYKMMKKHLPVVGADAITKGAQKKDRNKYSELLKIGEECDDNIDL